MDWVFTTEDSIVKCSVCGGLRMLLFALQTDARVSIVVPRTFASVLVE